MTALGSLLLAAARPTRGAMSLRAHVFVAICAVVGFLFVVRLLRRRRMKPKYTLLWLAIVAALVPLAAFPGLLNHTSYAIGIDYPPAAFLMLAVAFLFGVIVHFSSELSRMEEHSRTLAEEVALLRQALEREHPPTDHARVVVTRAKAELHDADEPPR